MSAPVTPVVHDADTGESPNESGYPCGATVAGNGIYTFRNYKVACGQQVVGATASSTATSDDEAGCLQQCNSVKYCVLANYQNSTGQCDLYYTMPSTFVQNAGWYTFSLEDN